MKIALTLILTLVFHFSVLSSFAAETEGQQQSPPNATNTKDGDGNELKQTREQIVAEMTTNLSDKARNGTAAIAIGAHNLVREAITTLSRVLGQNNPILIGERGSGKSVTAETIAIELTRMGHEVLELDLNKLKSDTKYSGQLDTKLVELFEYAKASKGQVVIFIDEIHQIMTGDDPLADKIKKYLLDPDVKVIGATTLKEYRQHIMKDEAVARRFQDLYINIASDKQLMDILRFKKEQIVKKHGYSFDDVIIRDIIEIGHRYFPDKPITAILEQLLDHAGAELKLRESGYNRAAGEVQNEIESLKLELKSKRENYSNKHMNFSEERMQELTNDIRRLESEVFEKQVSLEAVKRVSGNIPFEYRQLLADVLKTEAHIAGLKKQGNLPGADSLEYEGFDRETGVERESLQAMKARLQTMTDALNDSKEAIPKKITLAQLQEITATWKRLNLDTVKANGFEQIKQFGNFLDSHFIGNPNAVDDMIDRLNLYESGVVKDSGPTLFSSDGARNVGEKLIYELYGKFTGRETVRFDMNEYSSKESANGLLGSTAGYIGYGEGGKLTEAIAKNPNGIFVFDNLHRADPSVKEILLKLIKNGRLEDSKGQAVDAKNITIVVNSNSLEELYRLIDDPEKLRAYETRILSESGKYSPEHLEEMSDDERFEETKKRLREKAGFNEEFQRLLGESEIVFETLTQDEAKKLAKLKIQEIKEHIREKYGVEIKVTDAFLNEMGKSGVHRHGAKNIENYALNRILGPVSRLAVKEVLVPGTTFELDTMIEKPKDVQLDNGRVETQTTRHFSVRNTKTNVLENVYSFTGRPEAIAAKTLDSIEQRRTRQQRTEGDNSEGRRGRGRR